MSLSHLVRSAWIALLPLGLAGPAGAQDAAHFVVRLGTDTVAVERYTRAGNRIEGRQVTRTPRTAVRDYRVFVRPDGTVSRYEIEVNRPGEGVVARGAIDFAGDSAVAQYWQNGKVDEWRMAAPAGSIPSMNFAMGVYEPAIARALAPRARRGAAPVIVGFGSTETIPLAVRRLGPDSVGLTNIAGESAVHVDAGGRILGWNGLGSNSKITAERVQSLDLDAIARTFAAREQQGRPMGILSPTDSVRASIGGAKLSVRYGRPSKRGRRIFGGIIPFGQVWRTGANDATLLVTDRDLVIAGTRVPAGSYSLFTIPDADRWTLIVSRQTGQFGTEYQRNMDLARIPMRREPLAQPVEQFTIGIEPTGGGGRLVLSWDDTRAWVPIEVR